MNDFKERVKADAKRKTFESLCSGQRIEKTMKDNSYFLSPEKLKDILGSI